MSRWHLPGHLLNDLQLDLSRARGAVPPAATDSDARIQAAYAWLAQTVTVTAGQGSSKGFSYLSGWMPAFPETTGYIVTTLLAYQAEFPGTPAQELSLKLGLWLQTRHNADGGIQEGTVDRPAASVAFNTGMVLQGYTSLLQTTGDQRFLASSQKCADFLMTTQAGDGSWPVDFNHVPHTYAARVAWALLSYAEYVGDKRALASGIANLDWVLTQQRENGFWDRAYFYETIPYANTHSLGYILEGLIEGYRLLGHERWLQSAIKAADPLADLAERRGVLSAYYNENWQEQRVVPFDFVCLTGVAQIALCWLKLHTLTGDCKYLNAGLKAMDYVTQYQSLQPSLPAIRGALPGSAPLFGRYAPFQFPNWAAKFLLDALMERRRALANLMQSAPAEQASATVGKHGPDQLSTPAISVTAAD